MAAAMSRISGVRSIDEERNGRKRGIAPDGEAMRRTERANA